MKNDVSVVSLIEKGEDYKTGPLRDMVSRHLIENIDPNKIIENFGWTLEGAKHLISSHHHYFLIRNLENFDDHSLPKDVAIALLTDEPKVRGMVNLSKRSSRGKGSSRLITDNMKKFRKQDHDDIANIAHRYDFHSVDDPVEKGFTGLKKEFLHDSNMNVFKLLRNIESFDKNIWGDVINRAADSYDYETQHIAYKKEWNETLEGLLISVIDKLQDQGNQKAIDSAIGILHSVQYDLGYEEDNFFQLGDK